MERWIGVDERIAVLGCAFGFADRQFDGSCGHPWAVLRNNCQGGVEEKERGKQENVGERNEEQYPVEANWPCYENKAKRWLV